MGQRRGCEWRIGGGVEGCVITKCGSKARLRVEDRGRGRGEVV